MTSNKVYCLLIVILFVSCEPNYEIEFDRKFDEKSQFWMINDITNENNIKVVEGDSIQNKFAKIELPEKGMYYINFESVFGDTTRENYYINRMNNSVEFGFPNDYYDLLAITKSSTLTEIESKLKKEKEFFILDVRSQMVGSMKHLWKIERTDENVIVTYQVGINYKLLETKKKTILNTEKFNKIIELCLDIEELDKGRFANNYIMFKFGKKIFKLNTIRFNWNGKSELKSILREK